MEKLKALYVTGLKGSGQAAYEKYANKLYEELCKIRQLEISEVSVRSPFKFPLQGHALEYGIVPLKVRLSHLDDVVHAAHQGLSHVLLSQSKRRVVTCLDVIPFAYPREYANTWLKRRLLWLMSKGIRSADAVVTISRFSKLEIQKHLGVPAEKIFVAYPAVDHEIFKPTGKKTNLIKKANGEKIVLYIGSEQPRKNLGVLLAAFAIAKKQVPGLRLVKVGRPQWKTGREEFLAKARELGIDEDIQIIENVPNEKELSAVYRSADVFVFPSLYEGFGLPPLEAMACGTPVVCSNAASLPEVVGEAALSLPPDNKLYFGKAIVKILKEGNYAKQLSKEGLKQAKKFTWKAAAKEVLKAYERVW